jgi:diguanylate cyclase (GGDEF)-like protein
MLGIIGLSVWGSVVQAQTVMQLDNRADSVDVEHVDYLETDSDVPFSDILNGDMNSQWQPYAGDRSRSLSNDKALWLKFGLKAPGAISQQWLLALRLATLHHVQVFTYNPISHEIDSSLPVGLKYPMSQRYKRNRQPAFPLPLVQNQPLNVYVKIVSPNIIAVPLIVIKEEAFQTFADRDLIVIGAILGTLLVMFLYNLSLYSILRERSYFLYSLYVGIALIYLVSLTGIGPCYIWPNNDWLIEFGTLTFAGLSFFCATLFVREFLELRKHGLFLLHSNTAILVIWGSMSLWLSVSYESRAFSLLGGLSLGTCLFGLGVALFLAFKKVASAIIFTFAWLVLMIGTMVFTLMLTGVLPFNFLTAYSQMFGMVVEMILLSFALAYRINLAHEQREHAQENALNLAVKASQERSQRIIAQQETLDLQRNLNETLEEQVKIRTQQFEDAMGKLEVANKELQALSLTDQLSQVANRRCFDENLEEEYRRAYREKQLLAIILIDIDHFKQVNDTYGHGVGDICISSVARILKSIVSRPGDLIARYGGEEFIYMLPNTSEEAACIVADKARSQIEAAFMDEGGSNIKVTASFGVAAWVPTDIESRDKLVTTADEALYQAKAHGRNRVVGASSLATSKAL